MTLSEEMIHEGKAYLEANKHHPFVQGLITGELTNEQIRYYDIQDISFENNEIGVINSLIQYSSNSEQAQLFGKRMVVQLSMLNKWLKSEPADGPQNWQQMKQIEPEPFNQMYQNHMTGTIQSQSVFQILPSFLAGEWIYIELGNYLATQPRSTKEPLNSMLMMADQSFLGSDGFIAQFFEVMDEEAKKATQQEQQQAKATFLKSCLLECYFWDAAYHQTTWTDWQEKALNFSNIKAD